MLPLCNPNQLQTDATTTASAPQQLMPSNNFQGHPTNFFPNSQSQMGIINPQIAIPFNNSNTHMGNGPPVAMSNRPPLISIPTGRGAPPNHCPFPLQNGMMPLWGSAASLMPHLGQLQGGFGPLNLNSVSMAPMNLIQSPSQFFPHNSGNQPQYSGQNAIFLNGQFCLQSPMPNQTVQMPMSNYTQADPRNMHLYTNQVSQPLTPQNPTFFANPQFGLLHSNAVLQPNQDQSKLVQSTMDANATGQAHYTTQRSQGNSPLPPAFGSVPPQHSRKDFHPSGSTTSQGNLRKNVGINNWNNNWKNSQNRNFTKNLRTDESHKGFSKNQFQNKQNAKGKFRFQNTHRGKGYKNDGARTCELANSTNQTRVEQRRSLSLNYTEQEIQQWREQRRKNHPSKSNIKEKLAETQTEPEVIDAKMRRQQLKEILAKQAELGCEVAEIPSCYLSDSEKQVRGKEVDNKALTRKEKFQNKYNKRGRFHQNERFPKKQHLADHDSSNLPNQDERFSKKQKLGGNDSQTKPPLNKKQPTLLQRLLSADIRRDKRRLLQVFRFMAMNSFFKDWPERPLRFPLVIVKDTALEGEVVEEKFQPPLSPGKGFSEAYDKTHIEEFEDGDYRDDGGADEGDNKGDDEHDPISKEAAVHFVSLKGSKGGDAEECEEEEGEIID